MSSLSHSFEVVIDNGGTLLGDTKSVYINIPSPSFANGWRDEVGNSFYREAERNARKVADTLTEAFNYLVELDKSFQAESFNFDMYQIENAIASLKVK